MCGEAEKFQVIKISTLYAFLLYQTLKLQTINPKYSRKCFAYLFFFSKSRVQFPAREGKNVFKNAKNDLEAVVEKMSKLLVIKSYIFFRFSSILLDLKSILLICYDSFLHTKFFPLTPLPIFYTLLKSVHIKKTVAQSSFLSKLW